MKYVDGERTVTEDFSGFRMCPFSTQIILNWKQLKLQKTQEEILPPL